MKEPEYLGEFELMVLLAVLRMGEGAYGVAVVRELRTLRGREVALGSVYAALERLERRGLARSWMGEATPERGGRAKRFFRVTNEGLRAVRETRKVLDRLWASLPPLGEETA